MVQFFDSHCIMYISKFGAVHGEAEVLLNLNVTWHKCRPQQLLINGGVKVTRGSRHPINFSP